MKNRMILAIVGAATLLFPLSGSAQNQQAERQGQREGFGREATETQSDKELTPGPGWKTCPRCTNNKQLALAYKNYKVEGHAFNPKDLSGVWGNNGMELDVKNVPPFTPKGQQMFDPNRGENLNYHTINPSTYAWGFGLELKRAELP